MADSRKPVQPAVAPEVPAPVTAPTHEWELALLRAHDEVTLKWQPIIGSACARIMHVLLAHVDGRRVARLGQAEIGRICGYERRWTRHCLRLLELQWNLVQRVKGQRASQYVISSSLLPDFGLGAPVAKRVLGGGPLFASPLSIQTGSGIPLSDSRPAVGCRSESTVEIQTGSTVPLSGFFSNPDRQYSAALESRPAPECRSEIQTGRAVPLSTDAHKENASARARGVVVVGKVGEYENSSTTTTRDDLSPLQQKLQELSPSLRYSGKAVAFIVRNCREREPTASFEEISGAIVMEAQARRNAPNPIGCVTNWSKDSFSMTDVARWREEEAQQREEELAAQQKREREAEQKQQEDEALEARRWAMQLREENRVEWDRLYPLARERVLLLGLARPGQEEMAWFDDLALEQMYGVWLEENPQRRAASG